MHTCLSKSWKFWNVRPSTTPTASPCAKWLWWGRWPFNFYAFWIALILYSTSSPPAALGLTLQSSELFGNDVCCLSRGLSARCLNTDTYCKALLKEKRIIIIQNTSLSLLLSPSWGKKTFTLMKLHPHLWTAHFPCIQIYIPLDFHTILPPAPIQCKWGLVSSIVPQLIHYSCGVLLSRGEFCSFAGGWSPLIYVCFMQSWCLPAAQHQQFLTTVVHSIKATCPI